MKTLCTAIAIILFATARPDAQCNNDFILISTGTDFGNWLETLDPVTKTTSVEDTLTGFSTLRAFGSRAYALSTIDDRIQILDPCDGFSTITSFYVGWDPRDIVMVTPDLGYVTRYDSESLLQIDANGTVTGSTNLVIFADGDHIPEMDQMWTYGGRLYICLQRVNNATGVPTGLSAIVVVDAATGELVDLDPPSAGYEFIPLLPTKPISEINMRKHGGVEKVYFAAIGVTGVFDGGVIECVANNPTQQSVILTEAAAGGDIYDVEVVSDTKGFATIKPTPSKWELIAFDPSTGLKIGASMFVPAQFEIMSDIEPSPAGLLLSYFNAPFPVGIRCFDMATNLEIPGGPIVVGDYPWDILVRHTSTTDASDTPVATALGQNYPNPFNPETSIPFTLARAGDVTMRIYHVSGVHVATLLDERRDAGKHIARWNGRDARGGSAPTGIYFVRMEANGVTETRKIALLK